MKEQGYFGNDKIIKVEFYENYVIGKHHRLDFKNGHHNSTQILKYVHDKYMSTTDGHNSNQ